MGEQEGAFETFKIKTKINRGLYRENTASSSL